MDAEKRRRRLDALLERERLAGLSADEKMELLRLMSGRNESGRLSGKR
jgi:hypothetical protein